MTKNSPRYWLAAFLAAWAVDFLFWGKPAGVSFPIFIILIIGLGYTLLWNEKARANWASHLLSGLIIFLAAVTALRSEIFTRLLAGGIVFGGLCLLVMTFRGGNWIIYRIQDFLTAPIELCVVAIARASSLPLFPKGEGGRGRRELLQKAAPFLRGLLLALPLVVVLAALLASADLIFAGQINGLLKIFNLSRLPEYLFRLMYILVLAYSFTGLYLQATLPTRWGMRAKEDSPAEAETAAQNAPDASMADVAPADRSLAGGVQAWQAHNSQFLGATEAFVVLGSVNLLFAFFVAIQFRYFFGGQANITATGYTYSEYARRGFFELVLVAVISLLLYLGLNAVTRREKPLQVRIFTILAVLLVGFVWVILASAFQRLLLYEDAYGFTSLRVYTHIFIPWLGLLLLATIVLQIVRREQYFGALLLLSAFGFALTFGAINIDGLIVRQNVARALVGADLDGQYLVGLSDDALPALVRAFNAPGQLAPVRDKLGAVLACRTQRMSKEETQPWQSYHLGQAVARQSLVGLDLSAYTIRIVAEETKVNYKNQTFDCYAKGGLD
jgi:hypothetical protein